MDLIFECTCTARLKPPLMVGNGPFGVRMVFEVAEGKIAGPRIRGHVLSAGADWLLLGADGWGRMDVRAQLAADDGAVLYAQFRGILEMNEAVNTALTQSTETGFDDQYFRVTPWLETGDPNYSWVNQSAFLGEGRFTSGLGIEYRLYRVT